MAQCRVFIRGSQHQMKIPPFWYFTVRANQKAFEWKASVIRILQPALSDSSVRGWSGFCFGFVFPIKGQQRIELYGELHYSA